MMNGTWHSINERALKATPTALLIQRILHVGMQFICRKRVIYTSIYFATFCRLTHLWPFSKSKLNLNSDRVDLVAPPSPIECLLYLPKVWSIQYKLWPERLTRLGNSNVLRLPVALELILHLWVKKKQKKQTDRFKKVVSFVLFFKKHNPNPSPSFINTKYIIIINFLIFSVYSGNSVEYVN